MKTPLIDDREILRLFLVNQHLRKLRVSFDFLLGHPIWWVVGKPNGGRIENDPLLASCYEIWHDPRIKKLGSQATLFGELRKRKKESRPFIVRARDGVDHFCVPLCVDGRRIGFFGTSGIKPQTRSEAMNLLASSIQLVLETCSKKEELDRLSATIRPRAVALSTVHTVHRIINSTLNLDELVSRLTHLVAQVLRAKRCALFLFEKSQKLTCKALVGYPKHVSRESLVQSARCVEARVAKTAQTVLRKKFICAALIDEDVIGVISVSRKKDPKGFHYYDQEILTTLAEEAVIAIKNAQLYEDQRKVTLGTIQSLAVILGTRIPHAQHPETYLKLALRMAEELKLNDEETQALHYATLLKDTAKIGIPDEILRKPSKLTGEEYRSLREHPMKGAKIVQSFESLKTVVPIILYSREKFDGTGYPKGLKGEKIPIGARILAVINAFEALVIGRPYRSRATAQEALEEIIRNKGTQFDPKIVDVFVRMVQKGSLKEKNF